MLRQKDSDYDFLDNPWPGGKPQIIVGDPGTSIISGAFTELAGFYGIHREVTEARQAWKKPHIERLFRTLRMDLASELNGYLPKRSPRFVVDHRLKDDACFLVEEFERLLVKYIVNGYNQSSHSSLQNKTPLEVWQEGVEKFGQPETVQDLEFANAFGGNLAKRKLDPVTGIHLNNLKYHSRDLQDLYAKLVNHFGDRCTVELRWSSQDLSQISVLDPVSRTYLVVPCTRDIAHGMTLAKFQAQNRVVRESIRSNGIADSEELRNGQSRLKKMRGMKRRRRHPETTEATGLSDQELIRYLDSGERRIEATLPSKAEPSATESASHPPKLTNCAQGTQRRREFKVRGRN